MPRKFSPKSLENLTPFKSKLEESLDPKPICVKLTFSVTEKVRQLGDKKSEVLRKIISEGIEALDSKK